jgi:hypothetical protein
MLSQRTGRGFGCGSSSSKRHRGRTGHRQGERANQQNNSRHLSSPHCGGEVARRISRGAVTEGTGNSRCQCASVPQQLRHLRHVRDPPHLILCKQLGRRLPPGLEGCHSTRSSARASSSGEMERPSALAVFRLMTSSTFVGNSTGRSAGLAPFRIRVTKYAAWR